MKICRGKTLVQVYADWYCIFAYMNIKIKLFGFFIQKYKQKYEQKYQEIKKNIFYIISRLTLSK